MFEHLSGKEIRELIERPQIGEFFDVARMEAAHQRARWGEDHDASKSPEDWFWVFGYLAGKSLAAFKDGNIEKAKHHTISAAAVLAHWNETLEQEAETS